MSVPTSISQLNVTASLNGPVGTEPIGNNAALYFQSHAAFIAQVANGSGLSIAQNLSMNSHQINSVAAGTANTDAINLQQLKNYEPIGTIKLWGGSVANIAAAFGPNWALCNGQNGTPNLVDRFILAAGGGSAPGAVGGTFTYTLSQANMPVHSHTVFDGGHSHAVADGGHGHGISDNGHAHSIPNGGVGQAGADNGGVTAISGPNGYGSRGAQNTNVSGTGIGILNSGSNIGIYGSGTGISLGNAGSGAPFTVIPQYYALAYVMKISNS